MGAGIKNFHQSGRLMKNVLPKNATWIKEKVVAIEPEKCLVTTAQGRQVGQFHYSIFQPNSGFLY